MMNPLSREKPEKGKGKGRGGAVSSQVTKSVKRLA